MTKTTTRRIPQEDVVLLRRVQDHLIRKGKNYSQQDILDMSIKFAARNENLLLMEFAVKKKKSGDELLKEWLKKPVRLKEKTNSLKEHDITY